VRGETTGPGENCDVSQLEGSAAFSGLRLPSSGLYKYPPTIVSRDPSSTIDRRGWVALAILELLSTFQLTFPLLNLINGTTQHRIYKGVTISKSTCLDFAPDKVIIRLKTLATIAKLDQRGTSL
jgi:hypothetical protein